MDNTLLEIKQSYDNIISVMKRSIKSDGICHISCREIADYLGVSYTNINKKVRKLQEYDNCIEKISRGKYIIHHEDMIKYGVFNRILLYIDFLTNNPKLFGFTINEQSSLTGLNNRTISMIHGYLYNYLASMSYRLNNEGEIKYIIERGMAIHVDNCPINIKTWNGKSYANVIHHCLSCKYLVKPSENFGNYDSPNQYIICGYKNKV